MTGSGAFYGLLEAGASPEKIMAAFGESNADFFKEREKYLLYK